VGVLVLNAGMEPLHTASVPHAVRVLVRKVAEVHEAEADTTFGHYPLPKVVRPLLWSWPCCPNKEHGQKFHPNHGQH
jgi:hypothetical protein